jgi:exodeoxyribonuclease-3
MKIVSWNVNGLRAVHRNGYWGDFLKLDADVYCLQEIKAEPEQLSEDTREIKGFASFFNPARSKKGYSGVAVYTKQAPETVEYGLGIDTFDSEGRMLTLHLPNNVALCNIYFPNAGMGPARLKFKLDFYDAFLEYIEALRAKGKRIIFCGDLNTAHEPIDLARPEAHETDTGFLPEERAWIDELITLGYVDIFRHLYPDRQEYTYWDLRTHARERNVGWRLDYFFVSSDLLTKVKNVAIHSNVYGSDHCPVSMEIIL